MEQQPDFKKDYYWILGLSSDTATQADIKANFRKLAKKWHPDLNPNSEQASKMFNDINEAYGVLSDPQKKAIYDERRFNSGESMDKSPFMEMFRVKKKRDPRDKKDGDDIYVSMKVSFKDFMLGSEDMKLKVKRELDCPSCHGYGSTLGSLGVDMCSSCNGTGRQGMIEMMMNGMCKKCGGSGYVISEKCNACNGLGRVIVDDEILVDIPKGVNTGSMLRVAGMGNGGHLGGSSGDVYIEVSAEDDQTYHRQGQNLYMKMKLPFEIFVLGGDVEIPLPLGGFEKKTIPPLRNGKYSTIVNGRGVPYVGREKRGNLVVSFEAEFPDSITDEEKKFLEQYADERKRSKPGRSDKTRGEQREEEADNIQGHSTQ